MGTERPLSDADRGRLNLSLHTPTACLFALRRPTRISDTKVVLTLKRAHNESVMEHEPLPDAAAAFWP